MPSSMESGPTRVLVVEDEADVARLIKHSLERGDGMQVDILASGTDAVRLATSAPPDVLILDLNLPGVDGIEVCRMLRARPATSALPIIILTARADEGDRVFGLDLGADDYVVKPFSPRELAARVRAVLRRKSAARQGVSMYRGRHLTADFEAVLVTVDDEPVHLTRREFDLLRFLVENRNRVLSRERLLARVWGYAQSVETRSVDVHVGRLRSKLAAAGPQIETVVGLGYRFVE